MMIELLLLVLLIGIIAVLLKWLTGYSSIQLLGIAILKLRMRHEVIRQKNYLLYRKYQLQKQQEIEAGSKRYSFWYVMFNLLFMTLFIVLCAWIPQPVGLLLLIWVVAGQIICSYIERDDRPHTISLEGSLYWLYCLVWWPLYLSAFKNKGG